MLSTTLIAAWLLSAGASGQTLSQDQIAEQDARFRDWWQSDLEWRFDRLPTEGTVPDFRVPYSGHIYLDRNGGTINALRKYDLAFNGGRSRAAGHEQWDTTASQRTVYQSRRVGWFRSVQVAVRVTPHWHGHCNGWTAASIRHAEPQTSVVRNGVTFSPADIKGLLAEIYIYQDTGDIGGEYGLVNPAELHVGLTNWIGRHSHPIAMEADPGSEKWNYPIYGFASSARKLGPRRVEVRTTVRYAYFSQGEHQQSPRIPRDKYFHYDLTLDDEGRITGGYYYRDSSRVDLLWVPIRPKQGGTPGNDRGNPYVDVEQVLALWRESVPQDLVARWASIDTGESQTPQEEVVAAAEETEAAEPSEEISPAGRETAAEAL